MKHRIQNCDALIPFLFVLISCFSACLDEIPLQVPAQNDAGLVIRGVVLNADTPYILVKVTNLSNFRPFEIPKPLRDAQVSVTDNEGRQLEIPVQENGDYKLLLDDSTFAAPGKYYQLSVITPEGGHYLSTEETMYPVPLPTDLYFEEVREPVLNSSGNINDERFVRVRLSTPVINPDGSGKSFLKWQFSGVYQFTEPYKFITLLSPAVKTCYFYEVLNPAEVVIFNGAEVTEDFLPDYKMFDTPMDYRFREGYYVTVYQQSMSAGAMHYWEQVHDLIDRSAAIYDPPPGRVRGNMHRVEDENEEVMGYFYASQQTFSRLFISPSDADVRRFCVDEITMDNWRDVDSLCFDCLRRPYSTVIKPEFWEY